MKKIIKFILNLFDYFTEKKIINKFKEVFNYKENLSVIDVGAHEGEFITSINKNFKISKAYCFEPNPKVFQLLKKKFSDNNEIKLLNYGASNISDKITFNENIDSSSSSINDLNKNSNYYKKKFFFLNLFSSKEVTRKIEVKVVRLEDFILQNKIIKIDLFKIDTEGHEYKVLLGLGEKINIFKLIHLEHHFDDMIIKNYNLTDIHNYLTKKGFIKFFKIKMKFRKSFEYLYINKNF